MLSTPRYSTSTLSAVTSPDPDREPGFYLNPVRPPEPARPQKNQEFFVIAVLVACAVFISTAITIVSALWP